MTNQSSRVELAIIGGGVAGLTAGMYAARAGIDTVLLERMGPGGQSNNVVRVENYPGFPEGISGFDLGPRIAQQAMEAGVAIEFADVNGIRRGEGDAWELSTALQTYRASAVIVAVGSSLGQLGLPLEEELHGHGLSYCASCDGHFFKDQDVVVVGGGDSALDEALHLADLARHVTVIHRGDRFRGARVTAERLLARDNVEVRWGHVVRELLGHGQLEGVVVAEVASGATEQIRADGLFVYIGLIPNTSFLAGVVDLDAAGHVPVDLDMATPAPGLYAVGDIRQRSSRQFVSAAGDGATAALAVEQYLRTRGVE